jgi:hypothetical protein
VTPENHLAASRLAEPVPERPAERAKDAAQALFADLDDNLALAQWHPKG